MEEESGAPPGRSSSPTPEPITMEFEEPKESLKDEDHSEEVSEENEDGYTDDEDDGPGTPPCWQQQHQNPLLDMIISPPSSPLPPTPPLPSSTLDLDMEQEDSEDEGPPPGWDNTHHRQQAPQQMEQPPTPVLSVTSDINMENEQQDAQDKGPQPRPQAQPSFAPEIVPSELMHESSNIRVDPEDSEDEGPPPGWDSKCQPETKFQSQQLPALPAPLAAIPSDSMVEDEQQDTQEEGPPPGWGSAPQQLSQAHSSSPSPIVPSDINMENEQQAAQDKSPKPRSQVQPSSSPEIVPSELTLESSNIKVDPEDSEDEGPPPGWDSKCHPELKFPSQQLPVIPAPLAAIPSDSKVEDEQQDTQDEEGPPPGWCSAPQQLSQAHSSLPSPIVPSDINMENEQQAAEDKSPKSQSQAEPSSAPEIVPSVTRESSNIKVDHEDSEDEGPPPGWNSKCHPESEFQSQQLPAITPQVGAIPSDSKVEDEQQDTQEEEGPPPGWGSAPQQLSQAHSSSPSPILPSDINMADTQEGTQDEDGPPPGWVSVPQQLSQAHSPTAIVSSGSEQTNVKDMGERATPPPRQQSIPPTEPQAPKSPMVVNNPEMGQMVCGSCRRLLSYPKGARYVKCSCCLEENFVLEEHEVGQVICGGCKVLLMYLFGAPKVKCANCSTETEISDHNRRPPLSDQQRRARRHPRRVR